MTGLECLKEELIKKGFTKSQAESKVLIGALEILSNSNGKYTDVARLEQETKELEYRAAMAKKKCSFFESRYIEMQKSLDELADSHYVPVQEYVDSFFKALDECETKEGRDALKAAQMFVNSVEVETKYDNTAFIIGLASILAQGRTATIDELRKINPKIPKVCANEYYVTVRHE